MTASSKNVGPGVAKPGAGLPMPLPKLGPGKTNFPTINLTPPDRSPMPPRPGMKKSK